VARHFETIALLAILEKNQREQLRISLGSYMGKPTLHLRVWAKWAGDPEYHPTRRGFGIRLSRWPLFLETIRLADEGVRELLQHSEYEADREHFRRVEQALDPAPEAKGD